MGRVRSLDGLRGIAIAAVVAAHATGWPPGGYLGVDLFFALSGFLITTLLLEGRYRRLRDFYEARARRLWPALFVLLAVFVVVELATGHHPLLPASAGLFYWMNFAMALQWLPQGPLAPLWSLATEEQFYIVWPLLLIALLKWRPSWIKPFLALSFAAIVLRDLALDGHAPAERLLYAPDTRLDAIIAGCFAGVVTARGWRPGRWSRRALVYLLPLVLVTLVLVQNTAPALWLLMPIAAVYFAVLVTGAIHLPRLARLFALAPLVALGEISYALYLWHDPVLFAFGVQGRFVFPGTLIALGAAIVLAVLSTRFVEARFRRRRGVAKSQLLVEAQFRPAA